MAGIWQSIGGAISAAEQKVEEVAHETSGAIATAVHDVEERIEDAAQGVTSGVHRFGELMEDFLQRKFRALVKGVTSGIPEVIKTATDDPEMPKRAKEVKDAGIDIAWPTVQDEILLEMEETLGIIDEDHHVDSLSARCCFVAFVRYHLYPYNRGIWGVSQDPLWLLCVLIAVLPLFSATHYMFFLIWLLIDKTDEFQLLFYIVQVRGFTFVSNGILQVYLDFFQFISCLETDGFGCGDETVTGAWGRYLYLIGQALQFLTLWVSFWMLHCLAKRRRVRNEDASAAVREAGKLRGGNMIYLLLWDLLVTIAGTSVLVAIYVLNDSDIDGSQMVYAVKAVKVVHGFLCLPFFLLLTVPLLRNVVLHTHATGYDRSGRCRNYKGAEKKHVPLNLFPKEIFSKEEAMEVLDNLKQLLLGRHVSSLAAEKDTKTRM
mmetsp:Transcript_56847/g.132935  ORF Transcript_56847/g.132935 Transcript_56847/m.132935 type:complete len:432 (+) Transcript_56847:51-1346(+)